jgi:hypothetical protein
MITVSQQVALQRMTAWGRKLTTRLLTPNEEEFLWRGAATKTLLNGTAAPAYMEF